MMIFTIAFAIRKLIESDKIGSDFPTWNISLIRYPRTHYDYVHYMNWHKVDKLYHLHKEEKTSKNIEELSNLLIHSFVFMPVTSEIDDCLEGFYFNSDKTKNDYLFYIKLKDFTNLIEWIALSNVVAEIRAKDPNEKFGWKVYRKYAFEKQIPPQIYFGKKLIYLDELIINCKEDKTRIENLLKFTEKEYRDIEKRTNIAIGNSKYKR